MRAIAKAYSISLLMTTLAFGTQTLAADDPMVEKKKTYSKSYSVSSSDKVSLRNSFGEMKINTWDKNEVKVDVTITAEAGTDEKAQQLLDVIGIEDGKNGGGVYFKTRIGDSKNQHRDKGEKQSFNIDYVVYLPSSNVLDATNEFGAMSIGDYKGKAFLESKFGSLTAGNLQNARVTVEFGKATINSMNDGDLTIKFSRGVVNNLSGSVKANFEHCGGVKLNLDNDIKNLDIKNSFTKLYLDVNNGLSANYDISTSFCEVKNKTGFAIKKEDDDEDRGPKFDFRYSGKSGSGNSNVKVKASFGDVTIGHNIDFDVQADDKKDKKKTRNI